ncbi:MAG: aminomethyltransferase beta-barrel domain-containing protein, partial [Terriglobales bacterium]
GEVLGRHAGVQNFTVGQRKGLGLATGNPLYVIALEGDQRRVVVGSDDELRSNTLRARGLNWISVDELGAPMRVQVKIRHRHQPAAATLEKAGDNEVLVTFHEPQRAITPGQAAVFYDGEVVVGGGWIC